MRVLGAVLLLPAAVAWLWSYVLPTAATFVQSLQRGTPFSPGELVGFDNYQRLPGTGFGGDLGFALLLGLSPLGAALVVAPLLAAAAHWAGPAGRRLTRGLLAVPLVCYAPVAVAIGWRLDRVEPADLSFGAARGTLVVIAAYLVFGLVVAVASTVYLSVLRGDGSGAPPGRRATAVIVGAVLGLAVLAYAAQAYVVPQFVTAGGPARTTNTPALDVIQIGFLRFDLGVASAQSVLLLALLAVLGGLAVGLLVLTGVRIEVTGPAAPGPARPAGVAVLAVALVGFFTAVGYGLWPWLRSSAEGLPDGAANAAQVVVNTWAPPLVSAVVGVGLAALAGFGIGALRPLGRWSELLLLPFAPWVFVGTGPLTLAHFMRADDLGLLGTFAGRIPPTWLSIPSLVVFTLLFRGQHQRWQAAAVTARPGDVFVRTLLLPAVPMLAVAGGLVWLAGAQETLWPTVMAPDPDVMPAPLLVSRFAAETLRPDGIGFGPVLPIPIMVVAVLAFAALQIWYLDRLRVRR